MSYTIFFGEGHGNDWKHDREAVKWEYDREAVNTDESPQRSETPGLGGSLSFRFDLQSPTQPEVRNTAGREAQDAAQDPLDRKRQRVRPRRPRSGKGAREGGLGLVRRHLYG